MLFIAIKIAYWIKSSKIKITVLISIATKSEKIIREEFKMIDMTLIN